MKPSVKKEWVRKLTSGKYQQTTGTLRAECSIYGVSYCCLGVLRTCLPHSLRSSSAEEGGSLTKAQLKAAGLTKQQETGLIKMNDEFRRDFRYIAKHVDRRL